MVGLNDQSLIEDAVGYPHTMYSRDRPHRVGVDVGCATCNAMPLQEQKDRVGL